MHFNENGVYRVMCAAHKHILRIEHWNGTADRDDPIPPWHYEIATVLEYHPGSGALVTSFPDGMPEAMRLSAATRERWPYIVSGKEIYFHQALRLIMDAHAEACDSKLVPSEYLDV